eukprot:81348_1
MGNKASKSGPIKHQTQYNLPLHRFTSKDICNKIKKWIQNDINYKKHLSQTISIFIKLSVNGSNIKSLSTKDKNELQNQMSKLMTTDTLNIMFNHLEKLKTSSIQRKFAQEIAHMLYDYPLNKLLNKIQDNKINGKQINQLFKKKNNIIKINTGWQQKEIDQLQLMLFKYRTFTKSQFIDNMNRILSQCKDKNALPSQLIHQTKQIILNDQFNVEELHFRVKNAKKLQDFSDKIVNMVDKFVQDKENKKYMADDDYDLINKLYTTIARCFICVHDDINKPREWVCVKCNNYNFDSWIGGKLNTDIS